MVLTKKQLELCRICKEAKGKIVLSKAKRKDGTLVIRKSCNKCNTRRHKNWRNSGQNMKKVYSIVKKYNSKNKERQTAWYKVNQAIKKGVLRKPKKCENCGNDKRRVEAHHEDYSKPLQVNWLCRLCHRGIHRQ